MLHTLQMLGRSRKKQLPFTIVPTMYDQRTHASVSSLATLRTNYGDLVWDGKIPVDTKFRDASKAGIPPNLYKYKAQGVEAYANLMDELAPPGWESLVQAVGDTG